jgi:hypothetical protein
VCFNGILTDEQSPGNLTVGFAGKDELQYLLFPDSQRVKRFDLPYNIRLL